MIRALVAFALLLGGCASMTTEEKWALGLSAADVAMTAYALEEGGLNELNPILSAGSPSTEEVLARALVLNGVVHYLLHRYYARYTKVMERKYWRIVIGIRSFPVAWNAYQLQED